MKANNYSDKKRILAIDDSCMILNFVKAYLKNQYEVVTYESSSKALDDIASCKVDVDCILTDYHIPNDLSGLEFIQELRQIDPVTPVMILSGSCDLNEKVECLKNGAIDFINKPFNPRELEARIENALAIGPVLNGYRHAV